MIYPIFEGRDLCQFTDAVFIDAPMTKAAAMKLLMGDEENRFVAINSHGPLRAREAAKVMGGEAILVYSHRCGKNDLSLKQVAESLVHAA